MGLVYSVLLDLHWWGLGDVAFVGEVCVLLAGSLHGVERCIKLYMQISIFASYPPCRRSVS